MVPFVTHSQLCLMMDILLASRRIIIIICILGNLDDDSDAVIIPTHATGAIRVTVHQGDITEAGVCCIVNSSDSNMSLTGILILF